MSEPKILSNHSQQALSHSDQVSHDLETKGYSLISWKQLCCSTGEAAKAKRKQYKSERQQKQQRRNAYHHRNKDRIIQQKSFEIQDLVTRMSDLKRGHKLEMEAKMQQRDLQIKIQSQKIKDDGKFVTSLKREKEEMTAELESRDQTQAILLVDLRELCQVYDEEIAVLKGTIDRQALPPNYSSINNPPCVTALKDSGPATPDLVIAKALISIRKALASATTSTALDPMGHIASTLHTSLTAIKHGHKFHLWPRSSTAAALQAIHECVDRVTQFLTLHPDIHKSSSTTPSTSTSLFSPHPSSSINPNTLLRRAFAVADTLALEMCSLHFASGGRRAGLPLFGDDAATINRETDTKDDLLDLQYWKNALGGVRVEARGRRDEVGVVGFGDTVAWLEEEIMLLV